MSKIEPRFNFEKHTFVIKIYRQNRKHLAFPPFDNVIYF
jgi:hypothetical protein